MEEWMAGWMDDNDIYQGGEQGVDMENDVCFCGLISLFFGSWEGLMLDTYFVFLLATQLSSPVVFLSFLDTLLDAEWKDQTLG